MISFSGCDFTVERQPLSRPFHFKGGYFTEKWLNVVRLDADGEWATGVGGNAVLWSDARVFGDWSEFGGNQVMSLLAERAVRMARGRSFTDPIEAHLAIVGDLHDYARDISGRKDVTRTFVLNAMVALDLAMWKLHARQAGTERLDELGVAGEPAGAVMRVPLISYNVPLDELVSLARDGHRVLKVKIGQSGDPREMVEKDAGRVEAIHRALGDAGLRVSYYLDANGRYPDAGTLKRLLDRFGEAGLLDNIVLLEEPFPGESGIGVHDIPVRVAADESLHDVADLEARTDLGYGAVALKPAGKTLSLSVLMARRAAELGVPCFVADSACVPMLLAWNLAFAGLLPPMPGAEHPMLESNGAQNYANWDELVAEHPVEAGAWLCPENGLFRVNEAFHGCSGGIFGEWGHYRALFASAGH